MPANTLDYCRVYSRAPSPANRPGDVSPHHVINRVIVGWPESGYIAHVALEQHSNLSRRNSHPRNMPELPPRPAPPVTPAGFKGSLKLGSFAGIGVYVHWTFALLIGWVFYLQLRAGLPALEAAAGVGFILALFFCVLLHEFGHAFAARRYGIATRDITLLPIGGVARLESMPERPAHEFWVAIAGPAVNVIIALVVFLGLVVTGHLRPLGSDHVVLGSFWERLMLTNLTLVLFNLLPAFPMDGGRVLRAALASRMGRRRATRVAARIGQAVALILGVLGLFSNPFLVVLAVFVFISAQTEARLVEMDSALEGLEVRSAMMTRFRTLHPDDDLGVAVAALLAGSQQDFPVVTHEIPVGILRRNDLVKALSQGTTQRPVSEVMCADVVSVDVSAPLKDAVSRMHALPCSTLPVLADGKLAGLLTFENVSEFIVIRNAMNDVH
jgi:Zn-dependent protease